MFQFSNLRVFSIYLLWTALCPRENIEIHQTPMAHAFSLDGRRQRTINLTCVENRIPSDKHISFSLSKQCQVSRVSVSSDIPIWQFTSLTSVVP